MNQQLLHTPEGVRDIYGNEYAGKLRIQQSIHKILNSYGYDDIQTPTFEFFDVFSKEIGTTASKELYKFFDKEGNTLVLRPDFTPSMARCAAKYYMDEKQPIRFCYSGNTFTNTESLQGKLKEVTQMGAELIHEPSVYADAEMIALACESLLATGLKEFQISIGQVDYFKGITESAHISEEIEKKLRDYISEKNLFGAEEFLLDNHVEVSVAKSLIQISELFGGLDILNKAESLVTNSRSLDAVSHLRKLYDVLKIYGVEKYVSFDLGMLSKYQYYTGIIFKAYTYGVGDCVAKGGRYDKLLAHFGKDSAAIGFVVVVDDLLLALERQNETYESKVSSNVLSCKEKDFEKILKEAKHRRENGERVAINIQK